MENAYRNILCTFNDEAFLFTHCTVYINVKNKFIKDQDEERCYPFR